MRRSALSVPAALVLVALTGGGIAVASPPTPPQITDVSVRWGIYVWDDGTPWCTLIADATLDPAFTKGPPVYAQAYAHYMWVGPGGGTWQDSGYWSERLSHGATVHTYMGFEGGDAGYYVVDRVRVELTSPRNGLLSSLEVSTANTCENGPST